MRKSIVAFILSFSCLIAIAQSKHFMLVENKTNQNVMLKCNDEVFELGSNNFTTIAKLNIGTYVVDVFFLGKAINSFKVEILNFDRGFELLKDGNNFVLKEFNTKEIITDNRLEKTIAIENNPIQQVNNIETVKTEETIKEIKNVKLIFDKINKDGVDQIYVDGKDTIAIYIPNEIERQSIKIVEPAKKTEPVKTTGTIINEVTTNKNCKTIAQRSEEHTSELQSH